jgi:D-3-phosphoglycerate dehydrogenase / 2-oxoglutarate reductase
MKVVIPDDYQDSVRHLDCFAKLKGHDVTVFNDTVVDIDVLAARFENADALVLIRERTAITEELLARLPNLKLIAQTGKGAAHIDMDACARRGVVVRTGSGSPYAPAELTWALILAATRRIVPESQSLRAGTWQSSPIGQTVRGKTLGIYGYGKIGTVVARFGHAFGMNVLVWGREGSLERARVDGFGIAASKDDLFTRSDVLSLHLKLSAETEGIVTAADLARMKPSAMLVNTSRADLVAPGALESALRAGRPGFAAIDVLEKEPVGASHPLLLLDNVLATPHLGYVERDSYESYFGQAFDAVVAFDK